MYNIYKDGKCPLFKNSEIRFDNDSYIFKMNDNIIGHFNLIELKDFLSVEYEVLEKYRNQGYGTLMLGVIEEYVANKYDVDSLLLLIKYDNEYSLKIAKKRGYNRNYELSEEINETGEMTNYIPYVKMLHK